MKISRRIVGVALLLGLLLILGVLFSSFVIQNLVRPFALTLWLAWRVVLSIDQRIYWLLLILAALFTLLYRLYHDSGGAKQADQSTLNTTLQTVIFWRNSILFTSDETDQGNLLKRNLGEMLAGLYAARQTASASFEIYKALQKRQLAVPEEVYSFLFPPEPEAPAGVIRRALLGLWQAPGKLIRRWTHQDIEEYYQAIDEVIHFIESTMEMNYDQRTSETPDH